MKRILILLLTIFLLFSFVGCEEQPPIASYTSSTLSFEILKVVKNENKLEVTTAITNLSDDMVYISMKNITCYEESGKQFFSAYDFLDFDSTLVCLPSGKTDITTMVFNITNNNSNKFFIEYDDFDNKTRFKITIRP